MARFTAGLLHTAMSNVYTHEWEIFKQYLAMVDRGNIVDQMLSLPGENLVSHSEQSGTSSSADMVVVGNQGTSSMTPGGGGPGGGGTSAASQSSSATPPKKVYTRCERVHVFQLRSGHNQKLPMLVTLINSFLHYQTSAHLSANVSFSQHLHAVVAHFASLGPVARQYLLKMHTLSRLLRILLSYNSSATLPREQINEDTIMQ